jgi:hypothetical protein
MYTTENNGLGTVKTTMLTQDTAAAREPWETAHTFRYLPLQPVNNVSVTALFRM